MVPKGAIPDYRPLEPGEEIKEGDEVLTFIKSRWGVWTSFANWEPVENLIGRTCYYPNRIRRPVVPVTGKDAV
jgi:hypothetical protein